MKAYRYLAHAIAICVVLQAAWIAAGTFTLGHDVVDNDKVIRNEDDLSNWGFGAHSIFAMIIPLLAIALLIVAFAAKVPTGPKWAGLVFGDVVLQWVLAFIAFGVPAIGVLHAVNAFAIIGLAEMGARRAGAAVPEASAATPAPAV